jgi:hypothetical protein
MLDETQIEVRLGKIDTKLDFITETIIELKGGKDKNAERIKALELKCSAMYAISSFFLVIVTAIGIHNFIW